MAQKISYIVGAVLILLGIVGFFNDPIAGMFEVDTVHNLILIVAGLVLLGMAMVNGMAAMGAKVVGIVVAIVAILGFVPPMDSVLGLVETNVASSTLQAVVALVLLYAGFAGGGTMNSSASADGMGDNTPSDNQQPPMGGMQGGM